MNTYIDAHCHLCDGAVCGAADASAWVVNATNESQWHAVIDAAEQNPALYPAIGIHPWDVGTVTPGWDTRMADILNTHPRLMIGEIGLDRARGDWDVQNRVFDRQMDLAAQFNRPVHLHVVRAWDKIMNYMAQMRHRPPIIVMHGFRGNPDITRQLMRYDTVYFSFAAMNAAATLVPENRILVESDGRADTRLGTIVRDISAQRDTDMTNIIYNNTLRVIHHG